MLFCGEIIIVIYTIFAITIEDLELHCKKQNFPIGEMAIQFEPYAQKCKTDKYFVILNEILILIIVFRGICLTWEDMGKDIFQTSILYFGNPHKMAPQASSWGTIRDIRDY